VRAWFLSVFVCAVAAALAPAAMADTITSSNWAGYAVHRTGVSFQTVTGTWRQPTAHCTPGAQTYAAFWVGLGGYALHSPALEQTGTEVDCSASGKVVSSAWYELVPAPSKAVKLTVRPGDLMRATVSIEGYRVDIRLADLSRHRQFHKVFTAQTVDVSSAEWIVEAPSQCITIDSCQTLPLAAFAPTTFVSAAAKTTTGQAGPISDPAWRFTQITLTPGGHRYSTYTGTGPAAAAAAPSTLLSSGSSFAVDYALAAAVVSPDFASRDALARAGALYHLGR
jgi:hypothetical protein